jgi:hypothetical protein
MQDLLLHYSSRSDFNWLPLSMIISFEQELPTHLTFIDRKQGTITRDNPASQADSLFVWLLADGWC